MTIEDSINRASDATAEGQRRTWERPRLTRLLAGEAELGSNPAATEGAFAMGS